MSKEIRVFSLDGIFGEVFRDFIEEELTEERFEEVLIDFFKETVFTKDHFNFFVGNLILKYREDLDSVKRHFKFHVRNCCFIYFSNSKFLDKEKVIRHLESGEDLYYFELIRKDLGSSKLVSYVLFLERRILELEKKVSI